MEIRIPYGKEFMTADVKNATELCSKLHHYKSNKTQQELVDEALDDPIGSSDLSELALNKKDVVILASDHTRPVPSKYLIPPILRKIRTSSPKANITILIATGCHRDMTREELIYKFGEKIVEEEKIVMHYSDSSPLTNIGELPSGSDCYINSIAVEADLLISEGFIEPHFFAGYSGGRKSVLPGVAGRTTVLGNHCSEFIASPFARAGVLENNPIHQDMIWAAKKVGLDYILNVVINHKKEIIHAVSGDVDLAHKAGCEFLASLCQVKAEETDVVITSNGGFPLDQNIYQAVKGMSTAEMAVKPNGVIIMLAESCDGCGGDDFYHQLADEDDIDKTMNMFMERGRSQTVADQWQTQIFIRILQKAHVIYVSNIENKIVENMRMIPAKNIEEALEKAKKILEKEEPTINVIPDGVSLIVS